MKSKKSFKLLMSLFFVFVLFSTSLLEVINLPYVSSLTSVQTVQAAADEDWYEVGKDSSRTRMIDDVELKPPIIYKAILDLGWSVSQPVAVGDYMYVLAAVPDSNNFFQLPRGTYFYRIPVDFKFEKGLSYTEQIADLYSKGANHVRLAAYAQTYSDPTYNPQNGKFYIGVGQRVFVVDESPFSLQSASFNTEARLTGAPMLVGNDLFVIGTSTSTSNGGVVYIVKGLGTGSSSNVTFRGYRLSNLSNAELASTVAANSFQFGIGVNYRASDRNGKFAMFNAADNGFGSRPNLSMAWPEVSTHFGVAATGIYYNSHFYFADKYGYVYKVRAGNGSVAWTSKIPNVTLINNTMTTDGSSVYVPVRMPGKLVKLSMGSGSIQWTGLQGRQRNGSKIDSSLTIGNYGVANDPTYWRTQDGRRIVFYGDTAGQLNFLDTNGDRIEVAVPPGGGATRSSIEGSAVKSGVNWQYQGTGLAGEMLLAKKHLAFGVNTSSNMGEMWFYSVGVADDVYVKSVEGGNFTTGQNVITPIVIGSMEFGTGMRAPMVRLFVDGNLVGERRMSLQPGEEKTIYFPWTVENPVSNGQLLATINLNPSEFVETTYDNNFKYANYSSDGDVYINLCEPNEEHNMDIVKTVTVCDSEGNCYTIYYYEYLTTVISSATPENIRAGYGFEFVVNTLYIDETATYDGPDKVTSYMPNSPNYVTNEPEMDRLSVSSFGMSEFANWHLPTIYIEKYSGNAFYNRNDGNRDSSDELVKPNGERKWYTDFKTPDGPYIFKSVASEAGKNNLTDCYTYGGVQVQGSPFDDYVRRSVLPDTPFVDDEKGFNWKGKENILGGLIGYYYNSSPNTGALSTYYLTPGTISEIKQTDNEVLSKSSANYFFSEFDVD